MSLESSIKIISTNLHSFTIAPSHRHISFASIMHNCDMAKDDGDAAVATRTRLDTCLVHDVYNFNIIMKVS